MNKQYKELSKEELDSIKIKIEEILKPINGKVVLEYKPLVLESVTAKGSEILEDYKEFSYHIEINSDLGKFEYSISQEIDQPEDNLIKMLLTEMFCKLDGNPNGVLYSIIFNKDANE